MARVGSNGRRATRCIARHISQSAQSPPHSRTMETSGSPTVVKAAREMFCGSCNERLDGANSRFVPYAGSAETAPGTLIRQCVKCQAINTDVKLAQARDVRSPVAKSGARPSRSAFTSMLISSGFSFDGYTITKYSGYISGDSFTEIDRGVAIVSGTHARASFAQNLSNALIRVRREALAKLKEAAANLGCNAIIGVDFDYITIEPEVHSLAGNNRLLPYVVCVTANGNAVIIEATTPLVNVSG